MPTRNPTITLVSDDAIKVSWSGLLNGDDGAPLGVKYAEYADRSVQFQGTFGTGGTILLEGSNDEANYQTLTDPQGNAISKTAAAVEQVLENTLLTRPRVSAGDGSTNLVCTMFARRSMERGR